MSGAYDAWLWEKQGERCVTALKSHGFDAHFVHTVKDARDLIAETGVCTDCNSPQRICRITTILHRKPMLSDISVVLIKQSLGF